MASKDGRQTASVKEDLLKYASLYSYFQVIRLLRRSVTLKNEQSIKIRPELSFSFPASDIADITVKQDSRGPRYLVTATFLGLYGVSSPLPNFYTEDLFQESLTDKTTCRDFLDIFNQRLYELLYLCWHKYQLFFQVTEEKNNLYIEKLFCLLGLGEPELRKGQHADYLIRYLGLMTQWPRSAIGLRTILRDATNEKSLDIESCVPRKVRIPKEQQSRVGLTCSNLGIDTIIGSEIMTLHGRFSICIGPVSAKKFQKLIPGAKAYTRICNLTRFYLTTMPEYDIKITVHCKDIKNMCLGDAWSRLGIDTWLFTNRMPHDGTAIFYPQ